MIIHCTEKLLKEMGLTRKAVGVPAEQVPDLEKWYANLFYLRQRKCVIFVHEASLYAFVAYYVNREQIRNIGALLKSNLGLRLHEDSFGSGAIKKMLETVEDITVASTDSRSILGSMNEMVYEFSVHMTVGGCGVDQAVNDANARLVRGLYRKNGLYISPLEELAKILESK